MGVITGGIVIEGGYEYYCADTPVNGTDEVQTLTKSGTLSAGTFTLGFGGFVTASIAYNASAATIVAALEALPNIGSGGVTATGGPINTTAVVITFAGQLAKKAVPLLTLYSNSMTGTSPTIGIVETTPGVDATARLAPPGAELYDITHGASYVNTGTAYEPTWSSTLTGTEIAALAAAIPTAAVADIATADATDLASAEALANANKAKINDLLAKLRTAGIVTP